MSKNTKFFVSYSYVNGFGNCFLEYEKTAKLENRKEINQAQEYIEKKFNLKGVIILYFFKI